MQRVPSALSVPAVVIADLIRLLILADARARQAVLQLGLHVAGTAALLMRAQELGLIATAGATMAQLDRLGSS